MTVADALQGVSRLGLDTSPFIHGVEQTPAHGSTCAAIFAAIATGKVEAVASVLARTESLVKPLLSGEQRIEAAFRGILSGTSPGLSVEPVTAAVADIAADLRARYGLKTPDAIHAATAIQHRCDALLTGDKGLRRVAELKVLVLDDLTV